MVRRIPKLGSSELGKLLGRKEQIFFSWVIIIPRIIIFVIKITIIKIPIPIIPIIVIPILSTSFQLLRQAKCFSWNQFRLPRGHRSIGVAARWYTCDFRTCGRTGQVWMPNVGRVENLLSIIVDLVDRVEIGSGKFFFLWFFGRCVSALGESSYWEGLKRRLLFFVFGVLGTGIQVNLVVCAFFSPKQGGFQVWSTFAFSYFFPPSFKAVLAQVGLDMNGTDRWSTTNRNCCAS